MKHPKQSDPCPGCGGKPDRRNGGWKHTTFTCSVWATARAQVKAQRRA
jgi:hypothetical protein